MKRLHRIAAMTLLAATAVYAGESQQRAAVTLPGTTQWLMHSRAANRNYQIFVSTPTGERPASGYPALYVLDANAMFGTVLEAVRVESIRHARTGSGSTPPVVVGIGYPAGVPIDSARSYDLTPPFEGKPRADAGGAPAFLRFIREELQPAVNREFKTDRDRQALVGHSFGGLFVLYALFTAPDAFQTYVAASPSIWWDARSVLRREPQPGSGVQGKTRNLKLLVTVGQYEQEVDPSEIQGAAALKRLADLRERRQVDNARELVERLSKLDGLQATFFEFEGESHGSVIPAAVSRGVRFASLAAAAGPGAAVRTSPPPVPGAWEYVRLNPEQRYQLRLEVRALPEAQRTEWLAQLKRNLETHLPYWLRLTLHEERNAMDKAHGTVPPSN